MTRHSAKRTLLGFALAGCTLLATPLAESAHAQSALPSLTAVADAASFGVVMVNGQNFEPSDAVTIEVINPATGAVIQKVATGSSGAGAFTSTFSIAGACGLSSVALQAVDTTTGEASATINLSLPSPLSLAQSQLQGAEDALQSLLAAPPSIADTTSWFDYLQQLTATQAAVIAWQSQTGAAQSGACS